VTLDEFLEDFSEEPGYLDFAAVGPLSAAVAVEGASLVELLSTARFGTIPLLLGQDERVRQAVARATGFDADSVVFQPNTSTGLMHAMFGLTGTVALSPAEYPSITFAATRAAESLGVLNPLWLDTDHGRVTPGNIRDQLTPATTAVAVSLVDFRTGYLADLDGIRQVIGDRLLIVDAIQGFGVVDAPYSVVDVLVSGGQKWMRAGWGTGFLALSDRAREHLTPVWSGITGTDAEDLPVDEVLPATKGTRAFTVTNPDPIAEARLATALDLVSDVGVDVISARLAENVTRIIDLADEYALPVLSPRDERERAGIVILDPAPENLTVLTASLHNHGVSATVRGGRVRLAPHVSTDEETFEMLRASLLSYATATGV
jgi:selenocysteine lyase/cysteine desulfurase